MSASTASASGFPSLFAGVAGFMALSSFLNSRLVGRFGMRRLSHGALLGYLAASISLVVLALRGPDAAAAVSRCSSAGHVAVRLDRRELQCAGHGAARPCRRHGLLGAGLHADGRRRDDRRRASARPSTARCCRWPPASSVVGRWHRWLGPDRRARQAVPGRTTRRHQRRPPSRAAGQRIREQFAAQFVQLSRSGATSRPPSRCCRQVGPPSKRARHGRPPPGGSARRPGGPRASACCTRRNAA